MRIDLFIGLHNYNYTLLTYIFGCIFLPILLSDAGASGPPFVSRFPQVYEPSGVIIFPSADILIIEDEGDEPLHIARFADGLSGAANIKILPVSLTLPVPVSDLEGAAIGRNETAFLITSFSTTKKNKRKKKRQRLLQLKVKNGQIVQEQHFDHFLPTLTAQLLKEKHLTPADVGTLNIEGIAFDREKKKLLVGLRTPLAKDKAIIVIVENPYDIFSKDSEPNFSDQNITLNLGGGGIRGITYDHTLKTYLLVNEVPDNKGKLRPALWAWDGNRLQKPVRISLPKLKGVKNFEGVATITIDSNHLLLLVCDDGKRKNGKGGHYVVLNFDF